MPNWTENTLAVSGTPAQLKAFAKKMQMKCEDGSTVALSFNKVVPMPKVLARVSNGHGSAGDGVMVDNWVNIPAGKRDMFVPMDAAASQVVAEMCDGCTDWYQWSIKNWGVKWDCADPIMEDQGSCLLYRFRTPWGPPTEWYAALVSKFRKLTFELEYQNEDDGYEATHTL